MYLGEGCLMLCETLLQKNFFLNEKFVTEGGKGSNNLITCVMSFMNGLLKGLEFFKPLPLNGWF